MDEVSKMIAFEPTRNERSSKSTSATVNLAWKGVPSSRQTPRRVTRPDHAGRHPLTLQNLNSDVMFMTCGVTSTSGEHAKCLLALDTVFQVGV